MTLLPEHLNQISAHADQEPQAEKHDRADNQNDKDRSCEMDHSFQRNAAAGIRQP